MKKKTILIAGGAGFIGSHLCALFLKRGMKVICVDNLISGNVENVNLFKSDKNFSFLRQDINKVFKVSGTLDYVLNFASLASPPDYLRHPLQTLDTGSIGTRNLLELSRLKKAVFLMASTSEVYGDPDCSPQNESYWGHVNPIGPRSVYDEAKRFSEALTMAYHRAHRMDAKIIRIFNTYGERMRVEDGRVIPNFIAQALSDRPLTIYGDGLQTRSYCYVDDLVAGIEKMLYSKYSGPINLGNPGEMSVKDLAKLIIQMTDSKSKLVYRALPVDDPKQRCPDIALAKKELSWSPRVKLREGLVKTIDYFKKELSAA